MYLFETARLKVRPLSMQDLPALTALLSDPAVMEYSIRGICDEAATRQFIAWCEACYAESGVGPWALEERATGELAGFCGINAEQVDGEEETSLGYRLARRYWHQGLATEAARAVAQYAFDENTREVKIEEFTDIIGRQFKQPKEGLGFDNSPSSHMWRTIMNPDRPL